MGLSASRQGLDEEILWMLRQRVRRRIIQVVGENGRISATTLREKLGVSTGSLYYNLRQLSNLVQQDSRRNYLLTEEGVRAYQLIQEQANLGGEVVPSKSTNPLYNFFTNMIFPVWLFEPLYERAALALVFPIISASLLGFLMIRARYDLVFLYMTHRGENFELVEFFPLFAASLLGVYGLASLGSHLLRSGSRVVKVPPTDSEPTSRFREEARFLASIVVSLLPLSLFPGLLVVDRALALGWMTSTTTQSVLLLVSQGLSLPFLIAAVSYAKNIRWERAATVALMLFYITIMVATILPLIPIIHVSS